jgi:hypothetical protein
VTADAFAAAIAAMDAAPMRERAANLGAKLRGEEDGALAAARFIEARCAPR